MPDTWFTADFHLGHANIIRYCGRPFESVAEMDAAILDLLNSSVAENDSLYFLGDFCRGTGKEALAYRKRIRCQNIFFVEGNHDDGTRRISAEFRWWKQLAELKVHDQLIVLCHYAMRVWHHSFRGAWHLYGHSHMGTRTAACQTTRWLCPWMSVLIRMTSARGTSTRSRN